MERIVKENYYLDIAETVLERSTCLRRQYGAIIVRNDEIVATGYNGAPRGRKNCSDPEATPLHNTPGIPDSSINLSIISLGKPLG